MDLDFNYKIDWYKFVTALLSIRITEKLIIAKLVLFASGNSPKNRYMYTCLLAGN